MTHLQTTHLCLEIFKGIKKSISQKRKRAFQKEHFTKKKESISKEHFKRAFSQKEKEHFTLESWCRNTRMFAFSCWPADMRPPAHWHQSAHSARHCPIPVQAPRSGAYSTPAPILPWDEEYNHHNHIMVRSRVGFWQCGWPYLKMRWRRGWPRQQESSSFWE